MGRSSPTPAWDLCSEAKQIPCFDSPNGRTMSKIRQFCVNSRESCLAVFDSLHESLNRN